MRISSLAAVLLALIAGLFVAPTVAAAATVAPIDGPTVISTGDIACDPTAAAYKNGEGTAAGCRQKAVAQSIRDAKPDLFIPLGDNQYYDGTYDKFMAVYDKAFADLKPITKPIPGNHEYKTAGGAGYYQYFGDVAAKDNKGTYSYDVGPNWHVIAINSNICTPATPCGPGSTMAKWIAGDLSVNSKKCIMAVWHHPVWSAGAHGDYAPIAPVWNQLNYYGVDLVLNGHDHLYQRFKPVGDAVVNADGTVAPPTPVADGMREFVVGTGGEDNYAATKLGNPGLAGALDAYATNPNPAVFGSLRMKFGDGKYAYDFLPAAGTTYADAGTADCRAKKPVVNAPVKPANVKIARAGDGMGQVTWDAAASPAAAPVTYTARVAGTSLKCISTDTTCTLSGMTNGTGYNITVTASNTVADIMTGPLPFTPATPPVQPGKATATVNGTTATVTWTAPTYDGGLPITKYTVKANNSGGSCTTTGALTCQVANLEVGKSYSFVVIADNAEGSSKTSIGSTPVTVTSATPTPTPTPTTATPTPTPTTPTPTPTATTPTPTPTATTPATKPGAPSVATLSRAGDGRVTVSVRPPASDGGSPITSYMVRANDGHSCEALAPATACTVSGLVNGNSYTFTAVAINAIGTSAASATSPSIIAARQPTRPKDVVATAGPAAGAATVKWTVPDWDGGMPITSYTVTSSPGNRTCTTTGALECTVTGLTPGQLVGFLVVANNEAGPSINSVASNGVVILAAGTPNQPTSVAATGNNGSTSVTFTPPSSNGGQAITNYEYSLDNGTTWTPRTPAATTSPVQISNLAAGKTYQIRLRAVTSAGPGVPSDATTVVTPTMATAPTALAATATAASATVNFVAPASDGGQPITNYEYSLDNGTTWAARTPAATTSPLQIGNLTAGKTYQIRLRAITTAGPGAASDAAQVTTPTAATAPTALSATANAGSATVNFTAPANDGGRPISNYEYSLDNGSTWSARTPAATTSPLQIGNLASGKTYQIRLRAITEVGPGAASDATQVVSAPSTSALVAMQPVRVADTRPGSSAPVPAIKSRIGAGGTMVVPMAGSRGVAADAAAVALNVTAVDPGAAGFLTVYPCSAQRPMSSSVNYGPGQTVPNAVVATLGTDRSVCVYSQAATDVVVDLNGWFPKGAGYNGLTPVRVADTRPDGAGIFPATKEKIAAGRVLEVPVAGANGVAADAGTVSLNAVAVNPVSAGYLTVFPCGATRPTASTLNFAPGQVVANGAMAAVGTDGKVCIYSSSTTDVLVDLGGWMPKSAGFTPMSPVRVADTRLSEVRQPIDAGQVLEIPVAGLNGVSSNASAVSLNVTVADPSGAGYLTVYPCGTERPQASSLNYQGGQVVANATLTGLGNSGSVCVFSSARSHVVVDMNGWFPPTK